MDEWLKLFIAGASGGFFGAFSAKGMEILYHHYSRRSERKITSERFIDEHLDPLLKSADELVGKLLSLAQEDFQSIYDVDPLAGRIENRDFTSLTFLMVNLWANIEILHRKALYVSITQDIRGKQLQSFMNHIASRRTRLVDRISQRAVGELMMTRHNDGQQETILFIEFIRLMECNPEAQRWLKNLTQTLSRTRHTSERQRLLRYGIVVHAMIDTLDPEHAVTRDRPSFPNKLSKKTLWDLKYRVFGQYLTFVPNVEKYLGPS